jgi:cell wall assembly regulator SMI1
MSDLWTRLEETLIRLHPQLPRGGLNCGASLSQIQAVEALLGFQFPDDLREAYLRFNGCTPAGWFNNGDAHNIPLLLQQQYVWLDLEQVATYWVSDRCGAVYSEYSSGELYGDMTEECQYQIRLQADNVRWIPVAVSIYRSVIYVDLDPTEAGTYGQVFVLSDPDGHEGNGIASSFSQLIEATLSTEAEHGGFPLNHLVHA